MSGVRAQVCPFSTKHYVTLRNVVLPAYQARSFKYVFYHQVQPWHPQSVQTHEAAIAVSKVAGEEAFWKYSDILMERAVVGPRWGEPGEGESARARER
jgi:hypothetical protein